MGRFIEFTTGIRSELVIEAYSGWLKKNERVLDVGCGDAILSEIIKKKFNVKIIGCDVDNYIKKKIPFVSMKNESSLPFPDKSFDVVMFNDALHHTTSLNHKKLLKEAFRVADKVLIFEDEPTLIGSIADWSINKFHSLQMPVTLAFRHHSKWMSLFKSLGIVYQFKKVRKPFLYPFTHESFFLFKDIRAPK
jgi:SAM-dependent methyltransferase